MAGLFVHGFLPAAQYDQRPHARIFPASVRDNSAGLRFDGEQTGDRSADHSEGAGSGPQTSRRASGLSAFACCRGDRWDPLVLAAGHLRPREGGLRGGRARRAWTSTAGMFALRRTLWGIYSRGFFGLRRAAKGETCFSLLLPLYHLGAIALLLRRAFRVISRVG